MEADDRQQSRRATRTEKRATVIGLGLIGSSLALALHDSGWHVSGVDRDEKRAVLALELGVVAELGIDRLASLVFIATPVSEIPALAAAIFASSENPQLVVSDVGGVKGRVVGAIDHPRFVGGHPMAGSEQEGPGGADRHLFQGATWVLAPTPQTDPMAFEFIRDIVVELGADPVALEALRHDELVALVSHLPHLTAANLMVLAADESTAHGVLLRLAAGGFRDMTRIAAGDPAIWPDIFRDNADAVLAALDELRARLDETRRIVAEGDREALIGLLERAKVARRNLPAGVIVPEQLVECRVPVLDRPGVLAEVTTVLGALGVNIYDLEIAHSSEGERGVVVLAIASEMAEKARAALTERGYRPALRGLGR